MNNLKILFNITNIVLLVYIWGFSVVEYFSLPERIPLHFDINGKPDSFGAKITIFIGAVIATIIYFLSRFLSQNPDSKLSNIPNEMRKNKKLSGLFVRIVTFYVLLLFANITTEIVLISKGKYQQLSEVSTLILTLMFLSILGFFLFARKKVQEIH